MPGLGNGRQDRRRRDRPGRVDEHGDVDLEHPRQRLELVEPEAGFASHLVGGRLAGKPEPFGQVALTSALASEKHVHDAPDVFVGVESGFWISGHVKNTTTSAKPFGKICLRTGNYL
jgi:hypothetical protein